MERRNPTGAGIKRSRQRLPHSKPARKCLEQRLTCHGAQMLHAKAAHITLPPLPPSQGPDPR
eukprot:520849-Pyramimonas_sp.AAC.1